MPSSTKKGAIPAKIRAQQFEQNINKRGKVKTVEKEEKSSLGPIVIGFFLFVVVGSSLFQIIRTAQSGRAF